MRRSDLALTCLALASGCMRIYTDPELPDVIVEWFADDCGPETQTVAIALIGMDSTTRVELSVPCSDVGATLADVPRERYRIEGLLEDASGEPYSRSDALIDLRDGLDEKVPMYFGRFANVRVAWTFAMGATCESLAVEFMALQFTDVDTGVPFETSALCPLTPHFGNVPDGTFTLTIRAMSGATTVATSPATEPFDLITPELTDLGVITLIP